MSQLVLTASSALSSGGAGAFLARTIATTAASYAAGYADRLIFGPRRRKIEGPRLDGVQIQASQEGAGILRVYGRARIAGQLIWAANFKETTATSTESSGGKGSRAAAKTTYTEYLYSISFAVGLCEGEIDRIGRVFADGKPLDLSALNVRVYRGSQTQPPDALIAATEGAAPGFRGLAYVVFEDLPLKDFGNRIPQLSFEVERSLRAVDADALENAMTAAALIPASGEFVYGDTAVRRLVDEGIVASENIHNNTGATDCEASLDALAAAAPNLAHVALVAAWFGSSTDAAACTLRPGVETPVKDTAPYEWRAGGVTRAGAHLVSSLPGGGAAYGGTPADRAVRETIASLKARGLGVLFHPFILMDVAGYPWRGRIDAGGAEGTAGAATAVAAFFGTAAPAHFSVSGGEIVYAGPAEWSFRRMILHYAMLCAEAGGVDAFLLGSELARLTTIRDDAGAYPAVAAMIALAADVRAILGPSVKISYGADWSEYFGHQPADGSGDVFFHLDPFWADANVDFVGVDNYLPLADWRDGFSHADALAGARGQHDIAYLQSNIAGGEYYDWYYADAAARSVQARTPITDGAYGEPFVFRPKDFAGWWASAHHNRPGGVRDASPTAWVPQSKPIWFTEIGAPAIDKAANQPNVFIDAKSAESAEPHFSSGRRDDIAQRRLIEAHCAYWRDAANNPVSGVYGAPMVDADRLYVYAWDARPYPDFPARADVWGDAANWEKGHWINGRLGRAPLNLLIPALAADGGFDAVDAGALDGVVTGYVVDRPLSARETIDPLADVFQFDAVEAGGAIRFQPRYAPPAAMLAENALAARGEGAFSLALAQEADLPAAFRLGFFDEQEDFAPAVAEARDPGAASAREAGADIPAVMAPADAEARARSILADAWVMRETLALTLAPSALALEPGDIVSLDALGGRLYRLLSIEDGAARAAELVRVAPAVYDAPAPAMAFAPPAAVPVFGPPAWALMDLPLFRDDADPAAPWFVAFADPWPGGAALYRSGGGAPSLAGLAPLRASMGRLETALAPAPSGRRIFAAVEARLLAGALSSAAPEDLFAGANAFAVEADNGGWEVAQFETATLTPGGTWRLAGLLRGQAGTEAEALAGAGAGARFVLLNAAVTQPAFPLAARGLAFDWQAGPAGDIPSTENFTSRSLVLNARGLAPLSPVRLAARREGSDIRLSWLRRTRIGGDSWEGEVPLGETAERYRVTILDGGAPVRSAETTGPEFLYDAAMIAADFGGPFTAPAIAFSVAQMSDAVGEGVAASAEAAL